MTGALVMIILNSVQPITTGPLLKVGVNWPPLERWCIVVLGRMIICRFFGSEGGHKILRCVDLQEWYRLRRVLD